MLLISLLVNSKLMILNFKGVKVIPRFSTMQGAGVSKLCIVQGSTVIRDKVKDNLQPD